MSQEDIFTRVLCKEVVKVAPSNLNRNYKQYIFDKLKDKIEGVCSRHGFVKTGSITIKKIAPGTVELSTLSGYVCYRILFEALICNPMIGNIVKAEVTRINRFGVLAVSDSIIEIIIAKNSINIQSEIDLDSVKVGDILNIEILGKKFELGEKKISVVGRVLKDDINPINSEDEDEDDDDDIVVVDGVNVFDVVDDVDDVDDDNDEDEDDEEEVVDVDEEDEEEVPEEDDDDVVEDTGIIDIDDIEDEEDIYSDVDDEDDNISTSSNTSD